MVWDGSDYLAVKPTSGGESLFVTMDGEVLAELNATKGDRDYLVDPLGSVAARLDMSGDVTSSFDYWPYGEPVTLPEDGEGPLLWVGSLGYYKDVGSRYYVRAREYDSRFATWMQIDPLWPEESAWHYVGGRPETHIDPSGRAKSKTCAVKICYRWIHGGIQHRFLCVDGPNGGCSAGLYSGDFRDTDPEKCTSAGATCVVVSRSCEEAQATCEEIRRRVGAGHPGFGFVTGGFCWGWSNNVLCSMCRRLSFPESVDCRRKFCASPHDSGGCGRTCNLERAI